jgi:hypothetical protein
MQKKYFLYKNKLIPFIAGGSVESVGSTLTVSFEGSFSFNPNTSKSTDILFTQLALGEGPIYRINPNGPQDIEIDDRFIDDLVDFSTNNTKTDVFVARYLTGSKTQKPMSSFSPDIVTPIRFVAPVILKSGISALSSVPAPPASSVLFFPTNPSEGLTPLDSIKVKFKVTDLRVETTAGTLPAQLSIVALLHDKGETLDLNNYITGGGLLINSIVTDSMAAELELKIPENRRASEGYNLSILKLTEDIAEEGFSAEVEVIGFDEIRKQEFTYPSTALAGYAVKATDFRNDSVPTYTSLLKGMIVDVPSNYNQPILASGEVDWRQVEVPSSGLLSAPANGYRTQKFGNILQTNTNINIYDGIWDGTYKKDWTENRVWIIRHLLVEMLGVPESAIDKYNFYNVAQYVDAVDPETGNFIGVDGIADGSFRYKPNGYSTEIINNLLGLPEGTAIKERRFVCGVSVTDSTSVIDLVTALASSMRAVFSNTGNKLRLIVDKPDNLPVAIFNETNIEQGSFKLSGVRTEDIASGAEVSYIDLMNHFKKETIVIDSSEEDEFSQTNRLSIDAIGCTRKSEAIRLAQYHLNTARNLKRKTQFTAFADASDLEVGDIISISHTISGVSYGFGGQVFSNSSVDSSTVILEHFTSPSITDSIFSSNTNPLVLKLFKQEDNKLDYYIISNSNYDLINSGNSSSGIDLIEVNILQKLNITSRQFTTNTAFSASTAPNRGDLWALGEINPNNIYDNNTDKLFRVEGLSLLEDGKVSIVATEYNSEILKEVDTATRSVSSIRRSSLNYVTPPLPILSLKSIPSKTNEGLVNYNLLLSATTDTSNYSVPVSTVISYGSISNIIEVDSQG